MCESGLVNKTTTVTLTKIKAAVFLTNTLMEASKQRVPVQQSSQIILKILTLVSGLKKGKERAQIK